VDLTDQGAKALCTMPKTSLYLLFLTLRALQRQHLN